MMGSNCLALGIESIMSSDKSASSGRLGARLLIIVYSAGIVLLGHYPIQKEYGSFWNFIDKKIINSDFDFQIKDLPRGQAAKSRQEESTEGVSWFSQKLAELRNGSLVNRKERARMQWPETEIVNHDQKRQNRDFQAGRDSHQAAAHLEHSKAGGHDELSTKDRTQLDTLFEKLP